MHKKMRKWSTCMYVNVINNSAKVNTYVDKKNRENKCPMMHGKHNQTKYMPLRTMSILTLTFLCMSPNDMRLLAPLTWLMVSLRIFNIFSLQINLKHANKPSENRLQILASPVGHQIGIVAWRRYGNRTGRPTVRVAQVVGQRLEFIGRKLVFVPQNVIVRRFTGALQLFLFVKQWNDVKNCQKNLQTKMRTQVKVKFHRMRYCRVHGGSRRYIVTISLHGRLNPNSFIQN